MRQKRRRELLDSFLFVESGVVSTPLAQRGRRRRWHTVVISEEGEEGAATVGGWHGQRDETRQTDIRQSSCTYFEFPPKKKRKKA